MNLPTQVQRLPGNTLVNTTSLVVGDQFVFQQKVWKVLAVKENGIDCAIDPTFFFYPSSVA
jgi:hypothetical protein